MLNTSYCIALHRHVAPQVQEAVALIEDGMYKRFHPKHEIRNIGATVQVGNPLGIARMTAVLDLRPNQSRGLTRLKSTGELLVKWVGGHSIPRKY